MRPQSLAKDEIEMPLRNENVSPVMTQAQSDALAERIASVLRARKNIGDERRMLDREYWQRNNNRSLSRYYKLRGAAREQSASN